MKIDRRGFLAASSSALVLAKTELSAAKHLQPSADSTPFMIEGKEVTVYATAENTNQRLTPTGKLTFKPMGQPLETQICVFVDPARKFQTMLGIGGAITDAAAETFAKLPKAKQDEVLKAYFDATRRIEVSFQNFVLLSFREFCKSLGGGIGNSATDAQHRLEFPGRVDKHTDLSLQRLAHWLKRKFAGRRQALISVLGGGVDCYLFAFDHKWR